MTQDFVREMQESATKGLHVVHVEICNRSVPLYLDRGVFPPRSQHSVSSRSVAEHLGNLTGQYVADIGCGSGVEAIAAALNGAALVDATDIYQVAVDCTRRSVELNNLSDKIAVHQGDLFESLPVRRYDLIIANLPIVDYQPEIEDNVTRALYDPGFKLHKRLFDEAKEYLSSNGSINFTHANLQSAITRSPYLDFVIIEEMILAHGYRVAARYISDELGYRWINYRIQPQIHRWHRPKRGAKRRRDYETCT